MKGLWGDHSQQYLYVLSVGTLLLFGLLRGVPTQLQISERRGSRSEGLGTYQSQRHFLWGRFCRGALHDVRKQHPQARQGALAKLAMSAGGTRW